MFSHGISVLYRSFQVLLNRGLLLFGMTYLMWLLLELLASSGDFWMVIDLVFLALILYLLEWLSLQCVDVKNMTVGDILKVIQSGQKVMIVFFIRLFYYWIWLCPFWLPLCMLYLSGRLYPEVYRHPMFFWSSILLLLPFIRSVISYSLAFLVAMEMEEIRPVGAIQMSHQRMKGKYGSLLCIYFFFGILLSFMMVSGLPNFSTFRLAWDNGHLLEWIMRSVLFVGLVIWFFLAKSTFFRDLKRNEQPLHSIDSRRSNE